MGDVDDGMGTAHSRPVVPMALVPVGTDGPITVYRLLLVGGDEDPCTVETGTLLVRPGETPAECITKTGLVYVTGHKESFRGVVETVYACSKHILGKTIEAPTTLDDWMSVITPEGILCALGTRNSLHALLESAQLLDNNSTAVGSPLEVAYNGVCLELNSYKGVGCTYEVSYDPKRATRMLKTRLRRETNKQLGIVPKARSRVLMTSGVMYSYAYYIARLISEHVGLPAVERHIYAGYGLSIPAKCWAQLSRALIHVHGWAKHNKLDTAHLLLKGSASYLADRDTLKQLDARLEKFKKWYADHLVTDFAGTSYLDDKSATEDKIKACTLMRATILKACKLKEAKKCRATSTK